MNEPVNWEELTQDDWVALAEAVAPIQASGEILPDEEFDSIADEIGDPEIIESALTDWKAKSPERFRQILESE